jgi:hypothetical protein
MNDKLLDLEQKLAAVMAPDTAMPILRKMKQV